MENSKVKNTDAFKISEHWPEEAKALRSKYVQLSEADVKCSPGKEDELVSRLGSKLNMKPHEVIGMLKKAQPVKAKSF